MGLITSIVFAWRLARLRDPRERQRFTIEWMAEHPDYLAREWETASNGVDSVMSRALRDNDTQLLTACMLGRCWLGVMGLQGGAFILRLDRGAPDYAATLLCTAFVVGMVQPLATLNEDGEAGMRRFTGSYFAREIAWFDATYPALQSRMGDIVAERDELFAKLAAPRG